MHLLLMAAMIAIAVLLRWQWQPTADTWNARWHNALASFTLPPLLLLSSSVAVLWMGHHGNMLGMPVSPAGCWFGKLVLAVGAGLFLVSLGKAFSFQVHLRHIPWLTLASGDQVRCLSSDAPFAAQVGFWRSQVIVSRGWVDGLTTSEQSAILRHEQAHAHYRDPFWFFWLGLVRRLTFWLPRTDELWQELLLLREVRADRWAMQDTDPILLAELLVKLARSYTEEAEQELPAIGFCGHASADQLEQRIEALINPASLPSEGSMGGNFTWMLLTAMPLILVWFHS
jgi:Zn-dependent protease with chaperone function